MVFDPIHFLPQRINAGRSYSTLPTPKQAEALSSKAKSTNAMPAHMINCAGENNIRPSLHRQPPTSLR